MSIVLRLEQALEEARQRGYGIRSEWLGGSGGGVCELRGRPWLFLDLALDPAEQLAVVESALVAGAEPPGHEPCGQPGA